MEEAYRMSYSAKFSRREISEDLQFSKFPEQFPQML